MTRPGPTAASGHPVVIVVLGLAGALGVAAGLAGRDILRRRAAARAWGRFPERP